MAVGWLDSSEPYTEGEVSEQSIQKLIEVYTDSPFSTDAAYRGIHPCPFCEADGDYPTPFGQVHIGAWNILVPGPGVLYYLPSTVIHYILEHQYLPPACFIEALHSVDLDSFEFVDQVAGFLDFPKHQKNPYATRLGSLLAKRRGVPTRGQLFGRIDTHVKENYKLVPSYVYPYSGLTTEEQTAITSVLETWKSEAIRQLQTEIDEFEGTKWFPHLQTYLEGYKDLSVVFRDYQGP